MSWQAEVHRAVEGALQERLARHNRAVAEGLREDPPPLAEGIRGEEFAPWLPPGSFHGIGGATPVAWGQRGLLILPRRPDEAVYAAFLRLDRAGPEAPPTGVLVLGTLVRRDGRWTLLRRRAELARLPDTEPAWSVATRTEMQALVRRWIEEQNTIWRTGRMAPGMVSGRYTGSLVAEQYADWHPGGLWRGDGAAWVADTVREAQAAAGKGWRWRLEGSTLILPRSADEAAIAYQVGLSHGLEADAPRSRGIFLETWVRREGGWALHRHLGELAWSQAPETNA